MKPPWCPPSPNSETDEYVFFVVDPKHENYECVQNVVNSQNYVAEYALHGYPITDGRHPVHGQRGLGFLPEHHQRGQVQPGLGLHRHLHPRLLRGHHPCRRPHLFNGNYVTDFPHIRQLFVDAYARLCAMRMFASRAADYMRSASAEDRRYLLYNPMVKMKVTTQGEEVINLLWDVIAAKGFEKDTYFEMAARDIRALPKLEGTVHVNMALIIKFMANYFFNPGQFPEIGTVDAPANDDFLFNQGPTKGLGKNPVPRLQDRLRQRRSAQCPGFQGADRPAGGTADDCRPDKEQVKDIDFLLNLGELFTLVAYGQLLIEKAGSKRWKTI
jgi:acyl-CoA dehydrogenase